jgi:membrane associated rhomboid family serine protease
MPRPAPLTDRLTFGGRLPWAIGLLIVLTVGLSLFAAFGDRHAAPLFDLASLRPAEVWRGQLWRLVTWPFIQSGPFALLWACIFLYWFGRDLAGEWGSHQFLAVFGAIAIISAAATCLVALVDPAVRAHVYLGGYAIECGMIVAWGLWFPDQVVRLYFVIPVRGYAIAWLTIAITVFIAFYSGWEGVLPELVTEGSTLAWLFRRSILWRWRRAVSGVEARRRDARRRKRAQAASVAYLKVIESEDDDEPPSLPPDVERQIEDLLRGGKRGRE